jgi:hypothetical protein
LSGRLRRYESAHDRRGRRGEGRKEEKGKTRIRKGEQEQGEKEGPAERARREGGEYGPAALKLPRRKELGGSKIQ